MLKEALDRGHIATAIVRHPEKLEKREISVQDYAVAMIDDLNVPRTSAGVLR